MPGLAAAVEYTTLRRQAALVFLGHELPALHPTQTHPRPDDRDLWYCNLIEPTWRADGVHAASGRPWGLIHWAPRPSAGRPADALNTATERPLNRPSML